MRATAAAKHREAPSTADGTTLAQGADVPPAKRRITPKHSPRAQKPVPKQWAWHEVLDAALALDHCDFLAVLSEMLLVRHEKEQLAKQRYAPYASIDIPFDDPLEDDPFAAVPAAIPLSSRRASTRKR
jgi:hypothetical protein